MASILLPSCKKCNGASMCVPECTPIDIFETLQTSPLSIAITKPICTGGLSGQWTMPSWRPREISIHCSETACVPCDIAKPPHEQSSSLLFDVWFTLHFCHDDVRRHYHCVKRHHPCRFQKSICRYLLVARQMLAMAHGFSTGGERPVPSCLCEGRRRPGVSTERAGGSVV